MATKTDTAVLPPPSDFGLPAKFTAWRAGQDTAIIRACSSEHRTVVACLPTGGGKSAFALGVARLLGATRACILTSTKDLQRQYLCITPETRVCTGDLRWVAASTVQSGNVLLGFDEFRTPNRRMWRPADVQGVQSVVRPCYRLTLDDGTTVTCSADHKWLVSGVAGNAPRWVSTEDLRAEGERYPPHYLCRVLDLWETEHDWDTGYLAAAFDGEGCFHQGPSKRDGGQAPNGTSVDLSFAQRENPMWREVQAALGRKNFRFTTSAVSATCDVRRLAIGGRRDILRFLGSIRPARLLPKLDLHQLGMLNPATLVGLVRKEFVGDQTVLAIQTSTHTYVAEGFASHNCDFAAMGLVEVKGQNAYPCRALTEPEAKHVPDLIAGLRVRTRFDPTHTTAPGTGCDEGPCHVGLKCSLRQGGCLYYDAVKVATQAELVVTNYAFWLTTNAYRVMKDEDGEEVRGIGQFDLLILDEAHDAPDALSSFLTLTLSQQDSETHLGVPLPPATTDSAGWIAWAAPHALTVELKIEALKDAVRQSGGQDSGATRKIKILRQLLRSLRLLIHDDVQWVSEPVRDMETGDVPARADVTLAPLWPAPLAEEYLFRGTPKLLLMSATVRPKTLDYLGINRQDAEFWEEPSTFPVAHRPIIHIPTTRMTFRTSDMDLRWWMARIDQIIRARPGVRGIIHTGSYQRMRFIKDHSQVRDRLIWHTSASWRGPGAKRLAEAVREYAARPDAVLISPALTTGYDFPGDQCRFQILTKVPFPDTRSTLVTARTKQDPDYGMYLAMQTLIQSAGRSTRAEDDWSECVAPETRILTGDLRWRSAGDLVPGDDLLCFDERGGVRGHRRKWKQGIVYAAQTVQRQRLRVIHEEGEIICTPEHPWLMRHRSHGNHTWKRADQLAISDPLIRLVQPWTSASTWVDGWLAGFFDGEGCLMQGAGRRNPCHTFLSASQKEGPLSTRAVELLATAGFQSSLLRSTDTQRTIRLTGGFGEVLRFLGQTRPARLLAKFQAQERVEEISAISYPKVLAVERLQDGPITVMETSAATYVAEGLASHNCFIIDDQIQWFLFKYKAFAAKWFLDAYQQVVALPPQPHQETRCP